MDDRPPDGATPIDPDESDALIPAHIATHAELNAWEQANIVAAEQWAFARRHGDCLRMEFVFELHRQMFADTWRWAGKARTTGKNVGVPASEIRPELAKLIADAHLWIDASAYSPDEIAARFHHRLVQIHAFPNGNGRHARLLTDLLLSQLGRPRFSWGRETLDSAGSARERYLAALKDADRGSLKALMAFAR